MLTWSGFLLAALVYLAAGASHAALVSHYEHFGRHPRQERSQRRFIVLAWPIVLAIAAVESLRGDG
ncbi:MAG: hypothetical protein WD825_17300 [Gemmatimonadaceae bacterium]